MPQASKGILNHSSLISNLKISHPVLLLWIAASVIIIEGGPTTCPPTHFVKYSSSSGSSRKVEGCRLCPECPEGHELSIPCGSNITDNTNIECVTCKETKTYSDSYGIENCKPCQQCGSRYVIQECTLTHNRKCGNETSTPTTASIESTPNITESGEAKLSTATTTSIESTATARQNPYHSTTAERSDSIMAYALTIPVTIAIVLAIFALTAILCRRRCKTSAATGSTEEELKTVVVDELNLAQIPADFLVSRMEQLCDENGGNLFYFVQKKLDAVETLTTKTWRSIGRTLKISTDSLNLIEAEYRASPTERLLSILKTSAKEPTMREFVQALTNCNRYDVANYICNWPWEKLATQEG